MLSSEFVILENPLPNEENVKGVYLLNRHLFIYGSSSWVRFDMRGNQEDTQNARMNPEEWPILRKSSNSKRNLKRNPSFAVMEFENKDDYRIIFWKGNLENDKMLLRYHSLGGDYQSFEYHRCLLLCVKLLFHFIKFVVVQSC